MFYNMDKKVLYTIKNNEVIQTSAYIKLKIKSGFNIQKEDAIILQEIEQNIERIFIRSKIYPSYLLYSEQGIEPNSLYFERKDICNTLKGNTFLYKVASPKKIRNFLTTLQDNCKTIYSEICDNKDRIFACYSIIGSCILQLINDKYTIITTDIIETLINYKSVLNYLYDDIMNETANLCCVCRQIESQLLIDTEIEYNPNKSILVLINDLKGLDQVFNELNTGILLRRIEEEDFFNKEEEEKVAQILSLPIEEIEPELNKYMNEEMKEYKKKVEIKKKQSEITETPENENSHCININDDTNHKLICKNIDSDTSILNIPDTILFVEEELQKMDIIIKNYHSFNKH